MMSHLRVLIVLSALTVSVPAQAVGIGAEISWADDVRPSVVFVETLSNGRTLAKGTGFVFDRSTYVVTAYHMVAGADTANVLCENALPVPARVLKVLPDVDLALLETEKPLPARALEAVSEGYTPREGEGIVCWGYQLGAKIAPRTVGNVSAPLVALNRVASDETLNAFFGAKFPRVEEQVVPLAANLMPGHSGAPVFNAQGRVLGVVSGGERAGTVGVSWIFPARPNLAKLLKSEEEDRHAVGEQGRAVFWSLSDGASGVDRASVDAWRTQLVSRYRQYLGRGVSLADIDKVVRTLSRCPPRAVEDLLIAYHSPLPWAGRYRDGGDDVHTLMRAVFDLCNEVPQAPIPPSEFTIRLRYFGTAGATKSYVRLIQAKLAEAGFHTAHEIPVKPKQGLVSEYIDDETLHSITSRKKSENRLVCYPRDAEGILDMLRDIFPQSTHRYFMRNEGSTQCKKEGDCSRVIDVVTRRGS